MPRARQVAVTGALGVLFVGSFATSAVAGPGSGFRITGTPVQAVQADDVAAAANLAVPVTPGRHRFDLAGDGTMRWVAVQRSTGTSLWLTAVTASGGEDELRIEVATPDGHECASDDVRVPQGGRGPMAGGVLVDPATVDESCSRADRLLVGTARESATGGDERPVELLVLEEPAARETASLPAPLSDVEDFAATWSESAEPAAIRGGASFPAAPFLDDGRYGDAIAPGGVRLYRVRADFGQRVEAAVRVPAHTDESATGGENAGAPPDDLELTVAVFGPGHRLLASRAGSVSPDSATTLGAATPALRYRNRESSDQAIKAASVAGPHYVLVAAQQADVSRAFPYQVDIQVTGDREGTPAYTGAGAPQDPVSADASRADDGPAFWAIAGPVLVGIAAAGTVGGIGLRLRRRT